MVQKKAGVSKMRAKVNKLRNKDFSALLPVERKSSQKQDPRLPSRKIQKEVVKKSQFLDRVVKSSLAAQPSLKKKTRRRKAGASFADLSKLGSALGLAEIEATARKDRRQKGLGVKGARKRSKITSQETVRLQQVLSHPQFRRDPFSAVAKHLDTVLPQAQAPHKERQNISGSRKGKQKRDKARLNSAMEP